MDPRLFKQILATALVAGTLSNFAAVESDLLCAYAPSTASAWGGEVNAQVNMANTVIGSNALNDQSGTGEHFHIAGYIMSSRDSSGEGNANVLGLVASDASYADVRSYAATVGADQVTYAPYNSTGSAGNAYQPGTYSSIGSSYWWLVYLAHEAGGHNYSLGHGDGKLNPKTIMLQNYCGGGAAWPYLYSNPNVWWNGVSMLGDGATTCSSAGNTQPNGGDSAYGISSHCQSMCDTTLRVVYAPVLNNAIYHWSFTNAPGSALAGTTNYDLVSGAPAVVRGNGATYTGSALRLPGGTTGNVAMSAMAAYIDLPNGILSSQTNITIEIWATPQSAQNWARIMDFGNSSAGELAGNPGDSAPGTTSQTDGLTLTACIGTDITQQRFEAVHNGSTYTLNSTLATTAGVQHHYAITFTDGAGTYSSAGGRWQWYRDGDSVGFLDVNNHLASIQDVNEWLGRSEWSADSLANNDYSEVRISNVALNQFQIRANYLVGPNFIQRSTTMVAGDLWNGGTRSFNTVGNWSDGLAPSAGKSYDISDFNLTTPYDAANHTFAGDSLHASGGIFFDGASGSSTITVNNFQIDNEEICNASSWYNTMTLAGNLYVTNNNILRGSGGPLVVSANLNGNGSLLLYGQPVSFSGNNTNFTGIIRVGNGITGSLGLSSESQLGANPPSFTADQLILNRGWLYTTTSFAISNSNRGITIGVNDGIFDVASGTTLTLGCPLASGYISLSGNALTLQSEASGIVAGVLIKQNSGTLALTSSNPNYNGAISITGGILSITNAGQLSGGTFANPFTDNGVFDYSSSAAQTISSAIAGTGSITKNGSGTLTLSGANTMSGAVTVNGGTLYANPGNAANNRAFSFVSGITVNSGGTLQAGPNGLFGWDGTQEKSITVNSGGVLTCDSGADVGVGTVTLAGGTLANLGASTAYGSWRFDNAGDVLAVTADSTVSAVNVKFANGGAINVSAGKTLSINGTITDASSGGASSVVFGGTGNVVFTGANPYTGSTTINAGRVILTNTASLASSNIVTATGATFDVSGLTSAFTVANGQMLGGSGTNIGLVTTVSGAKISAGTDGGYGTNQFTTNVTMVSGAYLAFDLGSSAAGPNDKIIFNGNLNLNNTVIRIKAPSAGANLDATTDYVLATVAGTLSGTVNATPIWDVQPGDYSALIAVVTNGNQIVLHAIAQPPFFTAASVTPGSIGRNQTMLISAAATQGLYTLSNATANVTSIGGSAVLPLVADGAGNYTNSVAATPDTTFGAKNIAVTVTDSGNVSSVTNLSVTVIATNRVWNGGSASDSNLGSNPNWSTSAAPGFIGDVVVFDGSTRLTPQLETNYSVTGVTFNSTAGSFQLGSNTGKFLTLTGSGITNNSPVTQYINVPVSMGAAQTMNGVSGTLYFAGSITNNGNLLTVSGNSNTIAAATISGAAGLLKTGTGTFTLSGTGAYSGTTTVNAGTLAVSGSVPGTNITYVGAAAGKAVLTVSGALKQQNLLIGNLSGATGAVYQTSGTVTVTNGGGDCLNVGNVAGGFGYYGITGGTLLANGIAVGGENNSGTGFSGTGGNGVMEVSGGTVNNLGWFVMARGDTNETGVLNVSGGLFAYSGGGLVNCWGTNQTAVINVLGGVVSNSTAVGINLNSFGSLSNTAALNLDGGTVQATGVSGVFARVNFNGGTLKAGATNGTFVSGVGSINVYSNGATINDNGLAVGVPQALLAPTGNGVNGIASFTAGAGYLGAPIVRVNRGASDTTGVGATAIAQIDRNAGTVTNIVITCPGVNYTATPTFTLIGGGATTPATITGQAPTANISGGFTKTGSGVLSLGNSSTYVGATTISGGTLRLGDAVLHLTFDSVGGTTVTNFGSGGAAMNGTLTGTASIVSGGRVGKALSIPAGASSAAYVLVNSPVVSFNTSNTWSWGMWIQTSTAGAAYMNQGDGGWGSGNTTFYLNNGSGAGTRLGGVRYAQGWETGTANINDGAWHFIAMTDNNGVRTMYVDGAVDSITVNGWTGSGTGGQLRIGGTGTGEADGQVGLGGLIDEVFIYNRALSQAEVQALYQKNFSGTPVLPVATAVNLNAGTTLAVGGNAQTIGSLAGSGNVLLGDDAAAAGNFIVGNTNSTTFSGVISDAAFIPVVKTGIGTLTFGGANTYRGTTTVSNGTLLVNGALGTNTLTVVSGTLGGNGNIAGAVTVQGGTISPGSGIGKLTVSNSVTLNSGSMTLMEISKTPQTNDQLRVTGTLNFAGTLTVSNLSGTLAASDSFQLFSAGSTSGAFIATNLPPLNAGLGWSFNSSSGVLSVVQTVATNPTNISFAVSSGNLQLSWPSDHIGWRLLVQTNHLAAGLSADTNDWTTATGSALTNFLSLPLNTTLPVEFYRLVFP